VKAEVVASQPLAALPGLSRGGRLRAGKGGNSGEWVGRVVLFERGPPLTLGEKVRGAGDWGALGVVIMDDEAERCGNSSLPVFTQRCVSGSDKVKGHAGGGFAASDSHEGWEGARLPTLLVTREDGLKLLKLLQ